MTTASKLRCLRVISCWPVPQEVPLTDNQCLVTRSHKQNDRDHQGIADGTATREQHLPRYFAKHGHTDEEPNKYKKGGAGKANW